MSLQRKFALLLALLSLTVLANMGVALWAIDFMRRELAGPWASIQEVQEGLNTLKTAAAGQAKLLSTQSQPESEGLATAAKQVAQAAARLDGLETLQLRVGASTTRNISRRVDAVQAAARTWQAEPTEANRTAAEEGFAALNDLLERVEASVIQRAYSQVDFTRTMRPTLAIVIGASVLGVVLAGILGVLFLRRLVVRPVAILRVAADRLARGDFGHRVPVLARDELGSLSAEINHMAATISAMQEERVDRERLAAVGEMVRRLAHNLRNPLAGIRSLAELTLSDLPPGSPALESQERIISTVDRFEQWLAELLSATTPTEVSPQRGPVLPWIQAVLEPLRPMATARGVSLRLEADDAPREVTFDPRHLEHAVVAVVTNAVQATPRGGLVRVRVAACEDGQSWQMAVADSGRGVPPELGDRIFRPYFTTKRDGTGIGLAVAKQVVEKHRGRIFLAAPGEQCSGKAGPGDLRREGEQLGGAVFVLRLPLDGGIGRTGRAEPGAGGGDGGQDSRDRGRSESPVLDPADAAPRRA